MPYEEMVPTRDKRGDYTWWCWCVDRDTFIAQGSEPSLEAAQHACGLAAQEHTRHTGAEVRQFVTGPMQDGLWRRTPEGWCLAEAPSDVH